MCYAGAMGFENWKQQKVILQVADVGQPFVAKVRDADERGIWIETLDDHASLVGWASGYRFATDDQHVVDAFLKSTEPRLVFVPFHRILKAVRLT